MNLQIMMRVFSPAYNPQSRTTTAAKEVRGRENRTTQRVHPRKSIVKTKKTQTTKVTGKTTKKAASTKIKLNQTLHAGKNLETEQVVGQVTKTKQNDAADN